MSKGQRCSTWKNALRPYLKGLDILSCPSNPYARTQPGLTADPSKPGTNAEGWELEPELRMPISYAVNSCATTWIPADDRSAGPPLKMAQLQRASETMLIVENQGLPYSDVVVHWLWQPGRCFGLFAHSNKMSNFVFCDGHAKTKKWLSTLYPITENNWEAVPPNPDPKNRRINGPPGCVETVPAGPDAKEYQNPRCQHFQ
jgi:prepilin-type processing-associated H-X9-DG protein